MIVVIKLQIITEVKAQYIFIFVRNYKQVSTRFKTVIFFGIQFSIKQKADELYIVRRTLA